MLWPDLQALYDAAMKEKQDLEDDAQACRRKMANATALIDGLGGEKVRVRSAAHRSPVLLSMSSIDPATRPLVHSSVHSSICPSIICLYIRPDLVLQVRWTSSSSGFQTQIKHLVGDVLLSAGFLSYAGPFNQEYRSLLLELWKREMEEKLIPFSPVRRRKNQQVENLSVRL